MDAVRVPAMDAVRVPAMDAVRVPAMDGDVDSNYYSLAITRGHDEHTIK